MAHGKYDDEENGKKFLIHFKFFFYNVSSCSLNLRCDDALQHELKVLDAVESL